MIAIIFPMTTEIGKLGTELNQEDYYGYPIYKGTWNNKEVVMAVSGVGKTNSAMMTTHIIEQFHPEKMILCGVAATLYAEIALHDTVVVTRVANHDIEEGILDGEEIDQRPNFKTVWIESDSEMIEKAKRALTVSPHKGRVTFGPAATGDCFGTVEYLKEVKERLKPMAVDMETSSVAQVCYVHKIPFMAIRSISNFEGGMQEYEEHKGFAAENSRIVLSKIIKSL